jgi:hypothetical protein
MLRYAYAIGLVFMGLWISYHLALIGEPSSQWLWCTMGKLC